MDNKYEEYSTLIKAIADPSRLKIIDLLSCGEKCACELLKYFEYTQPTLSHHIKVLSENKLINVRKEGIWNYYSLNQDKCNQLSESIQLIISNTGDDCLCVEKSKNNGGIC